jgi:hypothetical protein
MNTVCAARQDAALQRSVTQWLFAGNQVTIQTGAAWAVLAGNKVTVDRGFVGVLLSPRAEIGEGGRVLLRPAGAAAGGVAFGAAFAVLGAVIWRLFGRRRHES